MTPTTAKALLDAGYKINVEKSTLRIFNDEEFEALGLPLLSEGSWVKAPKDHLIIGLKELPEEDCMSLVHWILRAHLVSPYSSLASVTLAVD